MKSKTARDDETRALIIQNSRPLFMRYGRSKTTMADIARASGMSAAHVYNFFPGKNAIIDAIGEEVFTAFAETITQEIAATRAAFEKITCLFMKIFYHMRDHTTPERELLEIKVSEGFNGWEYERNFQKFVLGTLEGLLRDAAGEAVPSDARIALDARAVVDCMFFGTVYSEMFLSIPAALHEERVRAQLDLIRSALVQRGYRLG